MIMVAAAAGTGGKCAGVASVPDEELAADGSEWRVGYLRGERVGCVLGGRAWWGARRQGAGREGRGRGRAEAGGGDAETEGVCAEARGRVRGGWGGGGGGGAYLEGRRRGA